MKDTIIGIIGAFVLVSAMIGIFLFEKNSNANDSNTSIKCSNDGDVCKRVCVNGSCEWRLCTKTKTNTYTCD